MRGIPGVRILQRGWWGIVAQGLVGEGLRRGRWGGRARAGVSEGWLGEAGGRVVVAVGGVLAVVVVRDMFFRKGSLVERSKRLWAAGAFGAQGWRRMVMVRWTAYPLCLLALFL